MSQPRPPERTERYLAIPCSGNNHIGTGSNHVYKILDYEHPSERITYRGWLSKERAEGLFEKTAIYFSQSHGLCPSCDGAYDEPELRNDS